MNIEQINARTAELRGGFDYLLAVAEEAPLTDEQRAQWDEAEVEFKALSERADDIKKLTEAAERAAAVPTLQTVIKPSTEDILNDRSATGTALADSVTRAMEERGAPAEHVDNARMLLKRHQDNVDWSRNLAARSTDVYRTAFTKAVTGNEVYLSNEERAALQVGSNTKGGFAVPTHLDPTLIITNNGSSNPIRPISRVVTLTTGNVWNGLTSAGATFSWDGELTEVSDDTPDFGRVSVPTYKVQGFIQGSVEALEDTNLAAEIAGLFADGRDRIEATAHATGSGSSQPTGIVTALDANTNVELTSTTAATIGLVDLQTTYRSVPIRWRGNGKWLMNPYYLGNIQALGTALGATYSTDLTQAYTSQILGKPVVESDEMPTTQTTTVRDNEIVYGDFSNYLIVDMPGSFAVQYIPVMFNTANNLPDGRVGWFAYWRTGADSVNDLAFRLLQDKTSA